MKNRRRQARPNQSSTAPDKAAVESTSKPAVVQAAPAATVTLDPKRRALFILSAMVLLPFLLVVAFEIGLRLGGYGYDTRFFRPLHIGKEDYLVDNDKFGWRFFPPEISRSPTPMRIPAHKPPGTYRIFLLGESAALGDPEPAYGMGRYLQVLLQRRYPQTRFEIVPAAMTAINSHAVLPIARECAEHQGDLWIIYMGNNEMIGPFGAITVFGSQSPPLWYVRMSLALQRSRVGQLLTSLGRRLTGSSGKHGPSWGGMQMFLKNQIAPGDRRRDRVYRGFQHNLEDIVRAGRSAGVPIILSTVAVNLKDCPPFASLPNTNSATYDAAGFDRLYAQGMEAQGRGDLEQAITNYEQASRLDPQFAELQFRWGQCLLGLTNTTQGRAHFQQARDDDALPFRVDTRLDGAIRETAAKLAGPDLALCDAVSLVARNSLVGIAGDESFYEHVHLNFDGNYRLALELAAKVASFLPVSVKQQAAPGWAAQTVCERDLGLTDWNRRDVLENMVRRFQQPPFTGQPANAQKAQRWEQRIAQLQSELTPTNATTARTLYVESIQRAPEDFRLHINFAAFLEATHDTVGAVTEWKQVQEMLPQYYLAPYQIGRLQAELDQIDDARMWLSRALLLRPDLSEGWYELGRVQGASGQFQAGLASFERASQLVPAEPRYRCEMAKALVKLQRRDEAIAQLEQAVRLGPISWEAHYLLGEQLAFTGRVAEARQQFEETTRLKPGFPMAHLNLGVALVKLGQRQDAIPEFEIVLRLDPANQLARRALSELRAR